MRIAASAALCLLPACMWGVQPTPTELQRALTVAATAWGRPTPITAIRMDYLNPCHDAADVGAWSDFATRTITINSACAWTPDILLIAVTHEYGHMLLGPQHSRKRTSVMYPVLWRGQSVTPSDRRKAYNAR